MTVLVDAAERYCIYSLGLSDQGAIVRIDIGSGKQRRFAFGRANHLSVHQGDGEVFSVVHHHRGGETLIVDIRSFEHPERPLAELHLDGSEEVDHSAFRGDPQMWARVPEGYVAYYAPRQQVADYRFISIDLHGRKASAQRLSWFDDSFDRDYQPPSSATRVPRGFEGVKEAPDLVAIAVQRVSHLYLYSPAAGRLVRKVELAGRHGDGSAPLFVTTRREAWVTDYDTLCRLDSDWRVVDAQRLEQDRHGGRMFIGWISLSPDSATCLVPRPGSGDVLGISTTTGKVVGKAALGREPLDAILLSTGVVFARDWKTGDVLRGRLVAAE